MSALYTPEILRLTTTIPHVGKPSAANPDTLIEVTKVSRICGSRLTVWASLDEHGRIAQFGQDVRACALGQASSSLFGAIALGSSRTILDRIDAPFRHMVATGETTFSFEDEAFGVLAPVHRFKGRHGSVLLPLEALHAVFDAVSKGS